MNAAEDYKHERELVERDCRAKWDRDPALRASYGGDYESFIAYTVAQSKGLVKVRGGNQAGGR